MPPRKPRTSKGSSATSVKEKAAAAHPAPVASTSGSGFPTPPTSNRSAETSDPVKKKVDASGDAEMEVGTPVTIHGGGINVGDEGPAAAVVEDDSQNDNKEEDKDEDSRSNSEGSHSGSESEGEDRHDGMVNDLDQLPHSLDSDDTKGLAMAAQFMHGQGLIGALFLTGWFLFANFVLLQMVITVVTEGFVVAKDKKDQEQMCNLVSQTEPEAGTKNGTQS